MTGLAGSNLNSAFAQTPVAMPVDPATLSDGAPIRGGSIHLVRPGASVENFNPAAFAQDPQIPLSYLEPLLRPDPRTMEPMPCLAETWIWGRDGRDLRFVLREDVVWHDGSPFGAEDAAFSYAVYQSDAESAVSSLFSLVESIGVTSVGELQIRFLERDGNWPFNAATLPIFPRGQYQAYWDAQEGTSRTLSQFDWHEAPPLGTGPWRVAEWDASTVAFSAVDTHWQQRPWLDELRVSVEVGAAERLAAWEHGRSQILWPVRPRDISHLAAGKGTAVAAPAASVMFAAFNFANPSQPAGSLWADVNVRRAVSMAIDRQRYADSVFDGAVQWDAAGTVAQPWAHDRSVKSPEFGKDAASIMLADAGWLDYNGDGVLEDANGAPFQPVVIVNEEQGPAIVAVLARVARDLAEVGIDLIVEVLPAREFDERWINRRDYDLIAYAYGLLPGFTDYDLYGSTWDIRSNPEGWNPGGYSNPDADAAIADFLSSVSIERQKGALGRLQKAVNDDLFGLWFGFPDDRILIADGILGFEPDISWQTAQTWTLWESDQDR